MTVKKLTTVTLGELFKRVPPNQTEQFNKFRKKTVEYHKKLNKYPDKLPTIDWQYYRKNVRKDYGKMVEEFQLKYEELDHSFSKRHEVLDHTKYYREWEALNVQVEAEVKQFIEESVKRAKLYEEEINRIKDLKYENMTLEEFVVLREDLADFTPGGGKHLFWPHNPEEQLGYEEHKNDMITSNEDKTTA